MSVLSFSALHFVMSRRVVIAVALVGWVVLAWAVLAFSPGTLESVRNPELWTSEFEFQAWRDHTHSQGEHQPSSDLPVCGQNSGCLNPDKSSIGRQPAGAKNPTLRSHASSGRRKKPAL